MDKNMTSQNVTIECGDTKISLPMTAMTNLSPVVALAHLVILKAPVQQSGGESLGEAGDMIAKAAASDNPLQAFKDLRDGGKGAKGDGLTARELDPGEKPGEDPAKRLYDSTLKCAESLGIEVPKDVPIQRIINIIARKVLEARDEVSKLELLSSKMLKEVGMNHEDDGGGFTAAARNTMHLGRLAAESVRYRESMGSSIGGLIGALKANGIIPAERTGNSGPKVDDCTNAINIAGRRGHKLTGGKPVTP